MKALRKTPELKSFLETLFFMSEVSQKSQEAFNLSWGCFSERTVFLIKHVDIFKKLNHYQRCKDKNEKSQTVFHIN